MLEIKCLASGSKGNSYFVDCDTPLLLDAGIPWKQIQQKSNFETSRLSGCLITHSHMDHCKAVKDAVRSGVSCYMSAETADAIGVKGHRIKLVRPLERFVVGLWTVLPFDTVHDAPGSLGFLAADRRGNKLVYLTDTAYCKYRFSGVTHFMVECNYSLDILRENVASGVVTSELKNRLIKTHMGLDTTKGLLLANELDNVREIWLLHMSENNGDAGRFKREVQELTGKMVVVAGE